MKFIHDTALVLQDFGVPTTLTAADVFCGHNRHRRGIRWVWTGLGNGTLAALFRYVTKLKWRSETRK